jgi:two-component system sensor histidine kinase AlgZ
VASINQTGSGIRLPNFCNLGVMLRSLVIANLFVLAAALLKSSNPRVLGLELASMAAFCEPVLIASLAILCAARRWLHAVGYVAAIAAIALLEVLLAWGVSMAAAVMLPERDALPFAHVASSPSS